MISFALDSSVFINFQGSLSPKNLLPIEEICNANCSASLNLKFEIEVSSFDFRIAISSKIFLSISFSLVGISPS